MKIICVIVSLLALPSLALADDASDRARAAELSTSVQRAELEQAIALYEQLLEKSPQDFELLLGASTAMNNLMSVATHQNLPFIEDGDLELSDTSANKKIWEKWAERAFAYAGKALEQRPKDPQAAYAYAGSYAYLSSTMGIVSAILNGAAGTYKENAQRIIELDPSLDHGVGYFFLAAFYLVAPWPISDTDETRAHLERALKVSPNSVRNHYLLAVLEFEENNWEASAREFQWVLDHSCRSLSERQVCGFLKKRSKIGLENVSRERD